MCFRWVVGSCESAPSKKSPTNLLSLTNSNQNLVQQERKHSSNESTAKNTTNSQLTNDTDVTNILPLLTFDFQYFEPRASVSHILMEVPLIYGKYELKNLVVWRLPIEISQSSLAGRRSISNACTIISLKIAEYIYRRGILFPLICDENNENSTSSLSSELAHLLSGSSTENETFEALSFWRNNKAKNFNSQFPTTIPCPGRLINCVANAIIEGNEIHEKISSNNEDKSLKNLTIPQALTATNNLFQELEYCSVRGSIIYSLPIFICAAIRHNYFFTKKQIFFLLIMVERCVVLVYQKSGNIIALLDPHYHKPFGAIIAFSSINNLPSFCKWMMDNIFYEMKLLDTSLQTFELSCISFTEPINSIEDTPLERPRRKIPETARKALKIFPKRTPSQVVTNEIHLQAQKMLKENRSKIHKMPKAQAKKSL